MNQATSLIKGGKVKGTNNPRARECIRLDTMETFGAISHLVENINLDRSLDISATVGGVWDAADRSQYGGFYKKMVWVALTKERRSKKFSTLNPSKKNKREKVAELLRNGKSIYEIRDETQASQKLIRAVRREHKIIYQPRRSSISEGQKSEIIEKLKDGANDGEIAGEVEGVTRRIVSAVRRENNILPQQKLSCRSMKRIAELLKNEHSINYITRKFKVGRGSLKKS